MSVFPFCSVFSTKISKPVLGCSLMSRMYMPKDGPETVILHVVTEDDLEEKTREEFVHIIKRRKTTKKIKLTGWELKASEGKRVVLMVLKTIVIKA